MGKKRKHDSGKEGKSKKEQKKQNVNNGVLRERLTDIGIFQNQTGKEILKEFLSPEKPTLFMTEYYQKSHKVLKRTGNDKFIRQCKNFFNKERFEAISKLEKVSPGRDFNLLKYSDGLRENHPMMEDDAIGADDDLPTFWNYANIMQLVNDQKYTLQFHQPQRFCDDFWRINAALEETFGTLVGANIYWTPKSTQGLTPPRWEATDAFVLQLNGTNTWKLWKNPEMTLPGGDSSPDLNIDELGEPIDEIVMEPGDMLYMPRGLVHCAKSTESSIHVTFSVNEHNSAAHWLSTNLPTLVNNLAEQHQFLRESVPTQFRNPTTRLNWIKATLFQLTESITAETVPEEDPLTKDFYTNRLPPFMKPKIFGKLKLFDLNCAVKLSSKEHIYVYLDDHVDNEEDEDMDDEDMDQFNQFINNGEEREKERENETENEPGNGPESGFDDDGGDDESGDDDDQVFIMHSWQNDRKKHMVEPTEPNCLKFPASYKSSIEKLVNLNDEEYLNLSELDLPASEAVQFAISLWAEGLLMPKE